MANILIDTSIDVVEKQKALIDEALGADGVYIRMKETLIDLLDKGELKGTDRAKVIAETIATMSNSITANAMSTGLQWASQEKELVLKKTELEYKLDILAQEELKLKEDTDASTAAKNLVQAQLIREYGTATTDAEGHVIALGDNGVKYEQSENVKQDTANKVKLNTQIDAQTEEVQARTHKSIADAYVNHGVFTWTSLDGNGVTGVTKATTGYTTLSDMNKEVAREQAKGYAYNAWSNAASASGGMIGTLVAAEIPDLDPTTYLTTWQTAVNKINAVDAPNIAL